LCSSLKGLNKQLLYHLDIYLARWLLLVILTNGKNLFAILRFFIAFRMTNSRTNNVKQNMSIICPNGIKYCSITFGTDGDNINILNRWFTPMVKHIEALQAYKKR